MLDVVLVVLTATIALFASLMARNLLLGDPERVEDLASVGLSSTLVAPAFGLVLAAAVLGLLAGWWIKPLAIVSILTIKLLYLVVVVAYKRSGRSRTRHAAHAALGAHSIASIFLLVA